MLREQLQKVLAESPKTTFEKHKIIMKILVELRMELEAKRKVERMNFIDLFAGVGGFRLGLEMAGHSCKGYVEIDKFARKSYEAIHQTEGEWTAHDITRVTDDDIRQLGANHGPIHIIAGGFPCQAFSVAGKRLGFEDTRGTLFFEIMRFARILEPKYLFLENVRGLLNHNKGDTFEVILRTMDELGYDTEWQVLNSKDFGVPQNRERVFIVGHSRKQRTRKIFPITGKSGTFNNEIKVVGDLDIKGWNDLIKRVYSPKGIAPTLNTCQGGNLEPKILEIRIKDGTKKGYTEFTPTEETTIDLSVPSSTTRRGRVKEGVTPTLDTGCQVGVFDIQKVYGSTQKKAFIGDGTIAPTLTTAMGTGGGHIPMIERTDYRIRKLTPRECFRLQGFPDWAFDKAAEVNSDSQLYKQAGNSVTVNVIYEIARRLN